MVHGDAVHGQAVRGHVVHDSLNDNAWIYPPRENNTSTPCEVSANVEKATRYSKMSEGYSNITSKQKLVVHVYSWITLGELDVKHYVRMFGTKMF